MEGILARVIVYHGHVRAAGCVTQGEWKLLFLLKLWVPLPLGTVANKRKGEPKILCLALHQGKEW